MNEIEIYQRKLNREKVARKAAETILEEKSTELFHANNQLNNLAKDIATREEKTRLILDTTADAILVYNHDNKIELCNQAACELFGFAPDELLGMDAIHLFHHEALGDSFVNINSIFQLEQQKKIYEVKIERKDQAIVPVEITISRALINKSLCTILVIRDIFERKQAEFYLSIQHSITQLLIKAHAIDEVFAKIIKYLCKTLHTEGGIFWQFDPAQNLLQLNTYWTIENNAIKTFADQCRQWAFKPGEGLPGYTLQSKKMQTLFNIQNTNIFLRIHLAKEANIHDLICLPIVFNNQALGVIEFFTQRAKPLDEMLKKILIDISDQIGVYIEKENTLKKLMETQRLSGMAQVATNVLHNVGNVLNSVNVSVALIYDQITTTELNNLDKITKLLQQDNEITQSLQSTEKGRAFITFILKLTEIWKKQQANKLNEITLLKNNINHIADIIKSQQSLSSSFGTLEPIDIKALLIEALSIHTYAFQKDHIEVIINCNVNEKFLSDKVKVLQILVNLIKNAYESIMSMNRLQRKIILDVSIKDNTIAISVIDNGQGISPKNSIKIFNYGFTTKKEGHGFGLHSCFLAAKELEGDLKITHNKEGEGAAFTLFLPFNKYTPRSIE